MAVLARFRAFGQSRFSGLGQVDRSRRSAAPVVAADRQLVGAGSGAGRGPRASQDRSQA
jgi:preprotein translocase subunit SecD